MDITVITGDIDISGGSVRMRSVQLFETIDKGMSIVQISGTYRAGNNTSETGANFAGVAIQAGVSGEWVTSVRGGAITLGTGTSSTGEIYGMGTGNGGIANITGLTTSDWVTTVGYGVNDNFIFINPVITDTQRQ